MHTVLPGSASLDSAVLKRFTVPLPLSAKVPALAASSSLLNNIGSKLRVSAPAVAAARLKIPMFAPISIMNSPGIERTAWAIQLTQPCSQPPASTSLLIIHSEGSCTNNGIARRVTPYRTLPFGPACLERPRETGWTATIGIGFSAKTAPTDALYGSSTLGRTIRGCSSSPLAGSSRSRCEDHFSHTALPTDRRAVLPGEEGDPRRALRGSGRGWGGDDERPATLSEK
mmetsp:Transcript_8448/g.20696  ORF Transcript_8448/g.20696 Transcript_8448/m.20696 type:complete len:228 (+) Transcript_8448:569-1252(+)